MAALPSPVDQATQSNYRDISTTHLELDWTVDWQQRILRGAVTHHLVAKTDNVRKVILDSSYLTIQRCFLRSASSDAQGDSTKDLEFSLPAKRHPVLGSPLTISLPRPLARGDALRLVVEYATTDECTALGWLNASQTDSKRYPFVYSQCQAIHARSMIPLFDTPAVKATYSARVRSTLPVLLSARRTSPPLEDGVPEIDGREHQYEYDQPIAIPSYLIAIAGGELAFRSLGERTGIWAEPGMIERCEYEFREDAERMVRTAEELCGPYRWGRYDALVLPSSFPYGGMEIPQITFLTPALIVGDRSQVDVVAHEASHSWHGNDVSCDGWDSFWLNEGWTTYTERLVALKLHGPATRDFEYIQGYKAMTDDLKRFDKDGMRKAQRLHIPYEFGEDPDEFYSSVAYDKGANFLYYLEKLVGLESFNAYQKEFICAFVGKSLTTQDWERHFWSYWSQFPEKEHILREEVDWDAWLNGEGLELPVKMEYDTTLADRAYALAASWDASRSLSRADLAKKFAAEDLSDFSANQVVLFLETLGAQKVYEKEVVEAVEGVYGFNEKANPEIKLRWFLFSLKAGLYAPEAAVWVRDQGRMKYCRPTYRAIHQVDADLARKTFEKYGVPFLHPIARRLIGQELGLDGKSKAAQ